MNNKTIILITALAFFFIADLFGQWQTLGDNIVPSGHRIYSLKIAPDRSVWCAATYDAFPPTNRVPKVLRSADDGLTWRSSDIVAATSNYLVDVGPIDSLNAFIACRTAGLHETKDGGVTWQEVPINITDVYIAHFFNAQDGLVVGYRNGATAISVTSDGGTSWTDMGGPNWVEPSGTSLPVQFVVEDLPGFAYTYGSTYDSEGDTFVVGASNGRYWISKDKGYNWERKDTPLNALGYRTSNITLKNDSVLMVASDFKNNFTNTASVSFATKDGGDNWIQGAPIVTAAALQHVPGTDSSFVLVGHNGFVAGMGHGTLYTENFGATWTKIAFKSLIAIDFLNKFTGYSSCCNNAWSTANGQIHKWDLFGPGVAIEEVNTTMLKVLPNPTRDYLVVENEQPFSSQKVHLQILASDGRLMHDQYYNNTGTLTINTSQLSTGFYSLKIIDGDQFYTSKFIKE